jgi:hypothetical protein
VIIPKDLSGNKLYKTDTGNIQIEPGLRYWVDPDVTIECTANDHLFVSKSQTASNTVFNEGIHFEGGIYINSGGGDCFNMRQLQRCEFHNLHATGYAGINLGAVNRDVLVRGCKLISTLMGGNGSFPIDGNAAGISYGIEIDRCDITSMDIGILIGGGIPAPIEDVTIRRTVIREAVLTGIVAGGVNGLSIDVRMINSGANIGSGTPFSIDTDCRNVTVSEKSSWDTLDFFDPSYIQCDKEFHKDNGETALASGDVGLTGWGASATVTSISMTNQGGYITVQASGAGISANPTVTLYLKDSGLWYLPCVHVNQVSGSGASHAVAVDPGYSLVSFRPSFTPVSGTTYGYNVTITPRG